MFSSKNSKTNNNKVLPISKTTSLFGSNKSSSPTTSTSFTTKSTGISNISPNKYLSSTSTSTTSSSYQYKSSTSVTNNYNASLSSSSSSWSSVQKQQSKDQKTSLFQLNTTSSSTDRNGVSSINKNAIETSVNHYKSPYLKEGTQIRSTAGGLIEGNKYTPSYISPYRSNTIENQNQNHIKPPIWNPASALTYPATALLSAQPSATSSSSLSSPKVGTSIFNKEKTNALENNGTTSNTKPLNNNKSITSANTSSSSWWKAPSKNPPPTIKMRGYIMVFNQEKFKDKTMNREGSRKDEEAICRTFYNFGFNPMFERDLRISEIKRKAKELSQKDFSNYGCVVIVVLSHGHEDETISAYDGEYNLNDTLVHPIARNRTLSGKPKIFIISACKGAGRLIADNSVKLVTDARPFTESTSSTPYTRDILKCYSTYEGYVSWRDPSKGTIFIQKLCEVLNISGQTDTIENIIKTVNRELTEGPNKNKQVPTIVSTMSQDFCFGQLKR